MRWIILVIGILFLVVVAGLKICTYFMSNKSKRTIGIVLVILALIGGSVALIRKELSPSIEERITEAVDTVFGKRTVSVEELKVAYEEIVKLKEHLRSAIERGIEVERRGDIKEAEGIIEDLRKSGDTSRLLVTLVKDWDIHKNQLIERNQEITAMAYLRRDIDVAEKAVDEILRLQPDNMEAITWKGNIYRLRGELEKAEDCYQRVVECDINLTMNRYTHVLRG